MLKFLKTIWICIYPILIYVGISLAIGVAAGVFLPLYMFLTGDTRNLIDVIYAHELVLTCVAACISIPIMVLFIYLDSRKYKQVCFIYKGMDGFDFLYTLLGGVTICLLGNILVEMSGISVYDTTFMEVNDVITGASLPVQIVSVVFIIPALEELIFRGLVFRRLSFMYREGVAVLFSSIIFGIFHGNITQGLYAFLVSLMISYAYAKTRKLLVPILMHIIANFTSLFLEHIFYVDGITLYVMVGILTLVCIATILYFKRRGQDENTQYRSAML